MALPSALAGIATLIILGLAALEIHALAGVRQRLRPAPAAGVAAAPRVTAPAASPTAQPPPPPPASPAPAPRVDAAGTVWLCRPGLPGDPCSGDLDLTSVSASGARTVSPESPGGVGAFDCFYVYPTVSLEAGPNADLAVQPAEIDVAMRQAAQFSRLCHVWAPMYRQRTLIEASPSFDSEQAALVEYDSLLAAWNDYLAHFNDGRPIIFIGHSTGTTVLIELLRQYVDTNPALRRRMVSALLMGGYPEVAPGSDVGGSFRTIPACRSAGQTGCVIGYNSYYGTPPPGSRFGRPGDTTLCTNPAALGGGAAALDSIFEAAGNAPRGPGVETPFVEYPGLYQAACVSAGGATWLQITPAAASPGDPRPRLADNLGPIWGLHAYDVNLALGNLLQDVQAQEAAYHG